jgi:hypothetical protein
MVDVIDGEGVNVVVAVSDGAGTGVVAAAAFGSDVGVATHEATEKRVKMPAINKDFIQHLLH